MRANLYSFIQLYMYNVDTFICTFRIYLFGLLTEVSYLGASFRQICVCVCVSVLGPLLTLFSFPFDLGLNIFRRRFLGKSEHLGLFL